VSTPTTSPSTTPQASPRIALSVRASRYGEVIADGSGRVLYLFDLERDGVPKCYGGCAVSWPPMPAPPSPVAGASLDQASIAIAIRTGGSRQLVYNGHPLYYYVGDHAPGEIKCQAAVEYGGGWYVIDPHGNKITAS